MSPLLKVIQPFRFRMSTLFLATVLLMFLSVFAQAQNVNTITYTSEPGAILNPERGFYFFTDHGPGGSLLSISQIESQKAQNRSLVMRNYTLSEFRDSDISENWLNRMHQDFATMREGGVKSVLRFRYTTSMSDPDAPLSIIERHLEQLTPVLEENADVIAVVEAGFIGAWGEWHSSSNGLTNTNDRRSVLYAILEALPDRRMVNVRTPGYKANIFASWDPITEDSAFNKSKVARTGHHNDGFLASYNDLGTYNNVTFEKNFLSQDTRFVPMGGETGGGDAAGASEHRQCSFAVPEMEYLNYSYLNSGWYGPTLDIWRDEGCFDEIEERLGYRFVMSEGRYSEEVARGNTFTVSIDLKNEGFSAPYNPRDIKIVLRSMMDSDLVYEVYLPDDPRFWQGGEEITLESELGIPQDMDEGMYELLLMLPDPEPTLHDRPEYAIRFANTDVWESDTGMNNLGQLIIIDDAAPGDAYEGNLWFSDDAERYPTSSIAEPAQLPDRASLKGNYPNPFNPSTTIRFELSSHSAVTLEVFDQMGRKVRTLIDKTMPAGSHDVTFDASGLSSGLYITRLTAGQTIDSRKLLLLK